MVLLYFPVCRFVLNVKRMCMHMVTKTQRLFAMCRIFIDRFHIPGHVDQWCIDHMQIEGTAKLKKVNTEVS